MLVSFVRRSTEAFRAVRGYDGRPGFRIAAVSQYAQAAHAEVASEFQVSLAIADHRAGGEVNIRIRR